MAPRGATAAVAGGGAVVQAARPARARVVTALGALAAAAAPSAYALALGGEYRGVVEALAGAGVGLLGAALVLRRGALAPWSLAAVGSAYVLARAGHVRVDGWSVGVGASLLLGAELAFWSIDHDARFHVEREVLVRRVLTLTALVATAVLLDLFVVAAAAYSGGSDVLVASAGVAAAVAAVALVLRLVRRT